MEEVDDRVKKDVCKFRAMPITGDVFESDSEIPYHLDFLKVCVEFGTNPSMGLVKMLIIAYNDMDEAKRDELLCMRRAFKVKQLIATCGVDESKIVCVGRPHDEFGKTLAKSRRMVVVALGPKLSAPKNRTIQ